jgi:23S rRNA (uracil1939-C5)-methyltransferase
MTVNRPWTDVTIERLAESGEGLGFDKSGVVLVPGALPGERVRVQLEKKTRLATAIEWVSTAPDRIEPACAISERCGGCDWLHVPRDVQRETRLDAVRRALPKEARDVEIAFHPAPRELGYRTRARIAWKTTGDRVVLGHRAKGARSVVDADACPVLDPALEGALAPLHAALAKVRGEGEVFLAKGEGGRPVATIRAEKPLDAEGFRSVEWLREQGFAGVELYAPGATAPATSGDARPLLEGADGKPLWIAPEGFAQANESLNSELVRYVVDQSKCDGRKVLELFAGAGNFTVMLAPRAKKVSAVEFDAKAIRALRENVAARGITNVSARECEALDAVVASVREDVVVLDPPRQGAHDVCARLALEPPRRLVYVSCDPATFGRDAGRLLPGMALEALAAFEMFPQTPHVELVGTFVRRTGSVKK